jgi:site-specific DNA recombinase
MEPVDKHVLKAVRDRLSSPDVADLLAVEDDGEMAELTAKAKELRARLKVIESDYDAGHIDRARFAAANSHVMTGLQAVERERATRLAGSTIGGLIAGPNPAEAFGAAPLSIQREVINSFMWIEVQPTTRATRGFDPKSVSIRWRRLRATVTEDGTPYNLPMVPVVVKELLTA